MVCSLLSWDSGLMLALPRVPMVPAGSSPPLSEMSPTTLRLARTPRGCPAWKRHRQPQPPTCSPFPPVWDPPNSTLRFTFQLQTSKPLGHWPTAASSLPSPAWHGPHRLLLGAGLRGCLPRAHTESAASRACLGAGAGIESKTPVCTARVFEKGHLAGLAVQAEFAGWF